MKKKVVLVLLLIVCIFILISKRDYKNLKKEYEDLNNKNYIKVTIPNDNQIEYSNFNGLKKIIKETGVIYIGSYENQASRDSIKPLLEAIDDTGIDKIYYIDIKEIKKENYKKLLNQKEVYIPSLITIKEGKMLDIISKKTIKNKNYKKMTKKEQRKLKEKYMEAIKKIQMCNPTGDTC